MIYRLQKRFILISTVAVLAVIVLVFGVMLTLNISSMNRNMDMLADKVSEGGGRFPGSFDEMIPPDKTPPRHEHNFDFITPETPFSTRHFTVFFDKNGEVLQTMMESIFLFPRKKRLNMPRKRLTERMSAVGSIIIAIRYFFRSEDSALCWWMEV